MAITEHDLGSVIGPAGPQGPAGPAGAQGAEGKTPSIGANGHWFVGDRDTGIMGDASKAVAAKIVNSLATTQAGYALDARQGKVLDGKIASLNSTLGTLNADLGGLSVTTREISNLHVDGVVYPGTTEITFMRFQASTSNRVLCIGFINASTNAEIWGKYINTNKIIIQKGTDGVWSNFTTV